MAEPARLLFADARERPILFSSEMVRAILDGRKTQTRRVVTAKSWNPSRMPLQQVVHHDDRRVGTQAYFGDEYWGIGCPFGVPGDRLWVRETFALIWPGESEPDTVEENVVEYRADKPDARYPGEWPDEPESARDDACPRWRPSIHMPRWASRLTLEITEVRVERLQEISERDATAEGFNRLTRDCKVPKFRALWDSLNATRAPWSSNPWVWAITFKRLEDA